MALGQIGLKANGLCIDPLVQHGMPGTDVCESIIREIDDTLTHNSRQLEECVRDLLGMSNNLVPLDNKFQDPITGLTFLEDNKILDKTTCYDPDPEKINKILKKALSILEKQPGCEPALLQSILELSSLEGLRLPLHSINVNVDANQSVLSINTVTDKAEQANDELWADICSRLKRYFLEKLGGLSFGGPVFKINVDSYKRIEYIESLCALFPASEIWPKYQSLRSQQFETIIQPHKPSGKHKDKATFAKAITQLETLGSQMLTMMREDFELLNSGIFTGVITTFKALGEIYLERFGDEVAHVTDILHEELSVTQKDMPKSTSEFGRMSHLKGPLKKQHSRSLDNLTTKGDDQSFTDLQAMPKTQLEGVVRLVNCVLGIENYLDTLHGALVWEVASKKIIDKSSLKGLLKAKGQDFDSAMDTTTSEKKPFSPRSYENSGLLPEAIPPPFGATDAMMSTQDSGILSYQVVEKTPQEDRVLWDWQAAFRKLIGDIAKGVEVHLRGLTTRALQVMEQGIKAGGKIEMAPLSPELIGGRLDYPGFVMKPVHEVLSHMEWMLPLARAGSDGPFHLVRSSYVDAVSLSLKDFSIALAKVSNDVAEKHLPLNCVYEALSSIAFIRNHLLHFDNILGSEDTSKKRFGALYRQYCDLVDAVSRQVIEYHTQLLSTSILQDAQSHDWANNKQFYEDERCSFAVQMWNLHMQGLRHDVWNLCPPKLAQSILSHVLQETLLVFSNRYARAKPSYKRTKQFQRDVTTILLVTSEMLYSSCNSIATYLDSSMAQQTTYCIHNTCNTLMASMAIVTAPIDLLYKVFKKGFAKKRTKGEEEPVRGYPSQWLSWIRSDLFPRGKTTVVGLQTTSAVYIQLKLLASQPECNWALLLHSILMKDYTLAILLLTQTAEMLNVPPGPDLPEADHQAMQDQGMLVFQAFTDILVQCADFPAALSRVLIPVVDRTETWLLFDTKTILGKTHPVPPWIQAIFNGMDSFIIRVLDPAIRVLFNKEVEHPVVESLVSDLEELPCGCPPHNKPEPEQPEANKDVLGEALYSLVTQLVEDVYTLPTPICMLFNALNEKMSDMEQKTPHNSAGLKLIATGIRLAVCDFDYVEGLVGAPLSEGMKDNLKMLAECTYHILTASSYGKGSGTPRIAGLFMKANRNWLLEQVEILTDHFSNEIFSVPDSAPFKGATTEYLEHLFIATSSLMLHTEAGPSALRKVYNFVINNHEWTLAQLDIPPLIGGAEASPPAPDLFSLSMEPSSRKPFNPLEAYKNITNHKLDQEAILEWPYDWLGMLQCDMGLTEINFRTLLYHRHEFQEAAFLEESEMKPVQTLKSKFDIDPADLV